MLTKPTIPNPNLQLYYNSTPLKYTLILLEVPPLFVGKVRKVSCLKYLSGIIILLSPNEFSKKKPLINPLPTLLVTFRFSC